MNKREPQCLFTTSWDDGFPMDLRIAELLTTYDLPGTFYIPRSSQRPVLPEPEIRALSQNFEIGGHTLDHVCIDGIPEADVAAQLSGSRDWLEQICGKTCVSFCFPGGKFRKRHLPLVHRAGFQVARTVELLSVASPRRIEGLALLPTTIQVFPHSPSAYARNILKRLTVATAQWPRVSPFSRSWTSLATCIFLRTLERGGVFHLWGHSWEIEERNQWKNLEQFLQTVATFRGKFRSVTNGELYEVAFHSSLAEPAIPSAYPESAE